MFNTHSITFNPQAITDTLLEWFPLNGTTSILYYYSLPYHLFNYRTINITFDDHKTRYLLTWHDETNELVCSNSDIHFYKKKQL